MLHTRVRALLAAAGVADPKTFANTPDIFAYGKRQDKAHTSAVKVVWRRALHITCAACTHGYGLLCAAMRTAKLRLDQSPRAALKLLALLHSLLQRFTITSWCKMMLACN